MVGNSPACPLDLLRPWHISLQGSHGYQCRPFSMNNQPPTPVTQNNPPQPETLILSFFSFSFCWNFTETSALHLWRCACVGVHAHACVRAHVVACRQPLADDVENPQRARNKDPRKGRKKERLLFLFTSQPETGLQHLSYYRTDRKGRSRRLCRLGVTCPWLREHKQTNVTRGLKKIGLTCLTKVQSYFSPCECRAAPC